MALIYEMSEEQKKIWTDWITERPQIIQDLAKRFEPNRLYRHKKTNRFVILSSFNEDGTLIVKVLRAFNNTIFFPRSVFGINPDDLEETELPEGIELMTFEEFEHLD